MESPRFDLLLPPLNTDVSKLIFSYLKIYAPILRLVCKSWRDCFPKLENNETFFKEIISAEHLDLLKFIYQFGNPFRNEICNVAASFGSLEVLKWAKKNGCPLDEYTCSSAAKGGHLE